MYPVHAVAAAGSSIPVPRRGAAAAAALPGCGSRSRLASSGVGAPSAAGSGYPGSVPPPRGHRSRLEPSRDLLGVPARSFEEVLANPAI